MYKIGELSKLSHLPVKTLRFYDEKGILVPDKVDKFTGYRFYSAEKLIECQKIILLKEHGYSLKEIKRVLNANSRNDILVIFKSKKYELEAQDKKIKSQIKWHDKMQKLMDENQHIFEGGFHVVGASYENFENDSEAVGKWKLIDIVSRREQFVYGNAKCSEVENLTFKELYFLKGGERYWTVDGWTKGKLFRSAEFPTRHTVAENYSIENIHGHTILFVKKNRIFPDGKISAVPEFWIYEKVSSDEFSARDIQIQDSTDYPFQPDSAVLGKWKVFDFYSKKIENFNPKIQNHKRDKLFVRSVEFLENGKCVYASQNSKLKTDWTRGLVLNHSGKTASAYQKKNIDGSDYLILEWKSGDYTYGGKTNCYVFSRK